ncbi:hypothetical protein FHETE_945 [Fusarium heterosporum]|uniref:Uncharacterized protein n=1 Tax=Fusarium heterosporum TaxID=42747 RepID=A0A8H5X2X2_FUSHE|nr:hypothetical protein FHETE_945 [Fusarium heterosporum]
MPLESLTPELVSLILQSVHSPRGLHDLIAASPACFRAFSQAPHLVLSAVIKNTIPQESIRQYLAILQTPSPATPSRVSRFLDKYFDNSLSFDFPHTRTDIISLYRLYNRAQFIINRYLCRMQELGLGDAILKPSGSESIRLERAFLRFELYSRIFPADDAMPWETPSANHQFSSDEQFKLFVARLKPWEVEEMACVELYYSLLINRCVMELEEQLIQAVKNTPGIVWPSSLKPERKTTGVGHQKQSRNDLREFKNIDLTNLSLFSVDGIHYAPAYISYISYMASLGLDFICSLSESADKRSELIRSNSTFSRQFLPEALNHSPRWTPDHEHEHLRLAELDAEDDTSYHNLGYHLYIEIRAGERIYRAINPHLDYYSAMRQLGYVFWDSDRTKSSTVSQKLEAAAAMTYDQISDQLGQRERPGAEEILKGVKLPREEFKKIERDFGDIRRPLPEYW